MLLCSISALAHAQKLGYKSIQIGVSVYDSSITAQFKEESKGTDGVILLSCKQTQYVCDEKVEIIAVVIDSVSVIKKVELYTYEEVYRDIDHFQEKFKNFSSCVVNTIGKAHLFDTGKDRKDGRMRTVWLFPELKAMFLMYTSDLSIVDRNKKRSFRLVWAAYNPEGPKTMW